MKSVSDELLPKLRKGGKVGWLRSISLSNITVELYFSLSSDRGGIVAD